MHRRSEVPEGLRTLAGLQAGVVTREQVRGHGLSDHVIARLVAGERWRPVAQGIYAVAPGPPSWEALAWSGVLLGGEQARLGAHAAGFLHGLVPEPPATLDVLVPPSGRYRSTGPWRFVRERPGVRSRSTGSPPRLGMEDTVLDLCAEASPTEVVSLVTRAVQTRRTRPGRLAECLAGRQRHPQRRLLRDLLGDVAEGCESPLELAYLHEVEQAHALPRGRRQASRLGLPYVSDVGYDAYRLLLELDGRVGHEGDGRFRDLDRDNRFALGDWLTLRYGWFDVVDRPCLVAAQVGAVLVSRGWAGVPARCSRCRSAAEADLWPIT